MNKWINSTGEKIITDKNIYLRKISVSSFDPRSNFSSTYALPERSQDKFKDLLVFCVWGSQTVQRFVSPVCWPINLTNQNVRILAGNKWSAKKKSRNMIGRYLKMVIWRSLIKSECLNYAESVLIEIYFALKPKTKNWTEIMIHKWDRKVWKSK